MPKMKTKKAIAAKVKVTGTGKLLRRKPGKRHLLAKKTAKRKRSLSHPALLDKPRTKLYKRMIGA